MRGIRGATTVARDDAGEIRSATAELLRRMMEANALTPGDLVSVIFTTTPDLTSEYPACAAGALGWTDVALLGAVEMAPPGAVPRCIRVLMHAETDRPPSRIVHVYLREATRLRPDR